MLQLVFQVQKLILYLFKGYFFTVCPAAIMRIAKYSLESGKTFAINLSAPFLSEFFKERIVQALPYVDLLFGNEDVNFKSIHFLLKF